MTDFKRGDAVIRLDSSLNAAGFYAAAGYRNVERCKHGIRPGVFIPCERMERDFDVTLRRSSKIRAKSDA